MGYVLLFCMDSSLLTPTSHQLHFKLLRLSYSPQLGKCSRGKNFSKDYRKKVLTGKPTPAETPKCGRFCPSFPLFQTDQKSAFDFSFVLRHTCLFLLQMDIPTRLSSVTFQTETLNEQWSLTKL